VTKAERIAPYVTVIGFFVLWEIGVRVFRVEEFILPTPSAAFAKLWELKAPIAANAWQTVWTSMIGFSISVVVGVFLGALIGYSKLAYAALYPFLVGFNSVPKAALVPIFVIWFGIGSPPAILTAFLISFFPIAVNVATGLATVEPELQDVLRALGASKAEVFFKVGLPRSAPYFFASLKVAVTLAFVGAVISEISASNAGIGYLMISASSSLQVPLVYAGLITIAAIGIFFYAIFALIEMRFTSWAYRK
jgi:NitT/TauT family transport system permease protein